MQEDEDRARRPAAFTPAVMDRWDVQELRAYIAALQAEITRATAAIDARDAQRNAADAFFRRPQGETK